MQEQKVINSATDYVSQAEIEVLDCNKNWDEIGLDETTDFCDATHTNFWGAEKVTDYLGKYLTGKYQFED